MGSVKKKASPKRRKSTAKKRGKKSMARKKVVRRKVRRRRNASTTTAKRRAAAKKGARTRAAKKAARSRAGKKAAATRKRRTRRPAKKVARRKNPSRKKTTARKTVRRKRKNPRGVSPTRKAAVAEAKRMGVKASGTTAAIQRRIAAKHNRLRGGSKKKAKRKTTKKKVSRRSAALRKARRSRHVTGKHSRSARAVLSRSKGKTKRARNKRGVARAYMRTRSVAHRAKQGYLDSHAKQMARVYGLTKVNPSFKSIMKEWKTMLPMGALAGGALLGGIFAGFTISNEIAKRAPASYAKIPSIVRQAIPAISAMAATTLAYSLIRRSKGKIAGINISRLAGPVALGGSAAAVLLLAMQSKKGKELMARAGVVIQAQDAGAMGSYVSVSRYLGDFVDTGPQEAFGAAFQSQDISPMGPSWYGRDLGMYQASDFPVHSPGPGDNKYVQASLGEGIFDGLGGALPDYELEQTPGGTIVSLSGGIFGGDSAI